MIALDGALRRLTRLPTDAACRAAAVLGRVVPFEALDEAGAPRRRGRLRREETKSSPMFGSRTFCLSWRATLWRFPVKSMGGEQLRYVEVTERGVLRAIWIR